MWFVYHIYCLKNKKETKIKQQKKKWKQELNAAYLTNPETVNHATTKTTNISNHFMKHIFNTHLCLFIIPIRVFQAILFLFLFFFDCAKSQHEITKKQNKYQNRQKRCI